MRDNTAERPADSLVSLLLVDQAAVGPTNSVCLYRPFPLPFPLEWPGALSEWPGALPDLPGEPVECPGAFAEFP